MKKKIGELTFNEVVSICKKQEKNAFLYCNHCPLADICNEPFDTFDEELNEEIEVEDDEKL